MGSGAISLFEDGVERFRLSPLAPIGEHFRIGALIYVPAAAHEGAAMSQLARALKPGGLLVIESFASDRTAQQRRPVDIAPAELKKALSDFEIVRFDDRQAVSEWDPQPTRLCRVIARKR